MHLPPRRNNTKILTERAPKAKVERTSTIIGDDATGLFDKERSGGVVLSRHPSIIKAIEGARARERS
jgi:hypothetical protein